MNESNLKLYSTGIVIEPKQRGSDQIKVSPMEILPLQSGDMSNNERKYETSAPDATGVKRSSKVDGSNYIVAKWAPDGNDNRITPPDVQTGETVKIYRFADTDEYYWTTVFREPKLRKLETVLHAVSDLPGAGAFNKDSSYWVETSTHDGHIHIHTAQSNGEPYGYDIKIDTANGKITIADTIENSIILDSASSTATVKTNTEIKLVSPKVTIEATDVAIKGNIAIDGDINSTGQATFAGNVNAPNNQM